MSDLKWTKISNCNRILLSYLVEENNPTGNAPVGFGIENQAIELINFTWQSQAI